MPTEIKRTLAQQDPSAGLISVGQDQVGAIGGPVVILGDPGLGKTVLTKALAARSGAKYVPAGSFTRNERPETLVAPTDRIIIDGLDEVASAVLGGAVEMVLRKLSAAGNPPFILSCREADWLGAAARIKIQEDYGVPPVVLHLQPFSSEDAHTFLSQEFPEIDAEQLLSHLADRGIEALYGNPLTLRMLGEVAQAEGPLPETRVQLLERACRVMLEERNPHHQAAPPAQRGPNALLLAVGAASATQLLCDRIGICTGPYANTPEGFLHVSDIESFPHGQDVHDALGTRLFQAEGERRFAPIHRVISEYLGAKWLAQCFEDGVSEQRIFALLHHVGGVPTSLRGLHAWIAHFSSALAGRCIAADPYAVLRYGNAETLDLTQARALLRSLGRLSDADPYFRSEDWGRHPASGLMRIELLDEILSVIQAVGRHSHLTNLLLEAMPGTALAREVLPELEAIIFDPAHSFVDRIHAWDAAREADGIADRDAGIRRLLAMGDPGSLRVACHILDDVGMNTVSFETGLETVLGRLGFSTPVAAASLSGELRYPLSRLCRGLDVEQVPAFLDKLIERTKPSLDSAEDASRADFADLILHLVARVLESDLTVEPACVWRWIGWLADHLGYDPDAKEKLTKIFQEDRTVRASLQEHVLLTPCAEDAWMAGRNLGELGLDLYPNADDLAAALHALRTRTGDGPIDATIWRDVLLLGRSSDGFPQTLHDAATCIANGDHKLLSTLENVSNPPEPEWMAERRQREQADEIRQKEAVQAHRDQLAARADEIATGNIHTLRLPARIYVGRRFWPPAELGIDLEASPEDRLRTFLGTLLAEKVLSGFVAALGRDDLPSAAQIVESYCNNQFWHAEVSMIAGVRELLRTGQPLRAVDRDTLSAAYVAWKRMPESNDLGGVDVSAALEGELFQSENDWEAHFRASIEPQLARDLNHVHELYRLTTDPQLSHLAGRLSVDWLRRFPTLGVSHQEDLLACAIENAPPEAVRALVAERRMENDADEDTKWLWLSAEYVVNFADCRDDLRTEASASPNFIWRIRDQVAPDRPERTDRFARCDVDQLAFVVEAFASHWPYVDHPTGTVKMGNCNPSDAAEFIRNVIYTIAGRPEPEASEALQRLVAEPEPTYANTLKHALVLQRKVRRDHEYAPPKVGDLRAVVTKNPPESITDMRAWFLDRLEDLQARLRGSKTDMWESYWVGEKPRSENFCRNRAVEQMSGLIPPSIQLEPEAAMPGRSRADIAVSRNAIRLPVEIKCQWHKHVWTAASDQLDARYTRDWQAERCGVYIVLWFGSVPRKNLRRHPERLDRPKDPGELKQMLVKLLPEARRSDIDVFVLDVSRPVTDA